MTSDEKSRAAVDAVNDFALRALALAFQGSIILFLGLVCGALIGFMFGGMAAAIGLPMPDIESPRYVLYGFGYFAAIAGPILAVYGLALLVARSVDLRRIRDEAEAAEWE